MSRPRDRGANSGAGTGAPGPRPAGGPGEGPGGAPAGPAAVWVLVAAADDDVVDEAVAMAASSDMHARAAVLLRSRGLLVRLLGQTYFWAGTATGWSSVDSIASQSALLRHLDLNAPVNYGVASAPIRSLLRRMRLPEMVLPRSVAFRRRYAVDVGTDEAPH